MQTLNPAVAVAAILACSAFTAGPGAAQVPAQTVPSSSADMEECSPHRVQRGETLGTIATLHFGSPDRAFEIYDKNQDVIGANPDLIEVGMRLTLPCARAQAGSVGGPVKAGSTEEPAEAQRVSATDTGRPAAVSLDQVAQENMRAQTEAEANRRPQVFYALSGPPFSPYVDRDRPGSGLAHQLIEAAFGQDVRAQVRISSVADRSAHLDAILPRGGFQLSFPWVYPDCEAPDLTTGQTLLCTDFIASDSFYEQLTEYFARADSQWSAVQSPQDMIGARLCRPAGYPTDDLAQMGLLNSGVTLYQPPRAQDCLSALDQGAVDIASLDATLARALVDTVPVRNPLIVLEGLTQIDRLHALALRGDRQGAAAIEAFNDGLAQLINSGEWFDIVDRTLRRPDPN
ncbi:MAG: hypothetical protein AAGA19_10485 [Pseudomonadota bacterium]